MRKSLVSVRIDNEVLQEAKSLLKTKTRSETVRRALEMVAEQARFRRWVKKYAAQASKEFAHES